MKKLVKINEEVKTKTYKADDKEVQLNRFLEKRIEVLKKTKLDVLNGFNFEELMKKADREYSPKDLSGKDSVSSLVTVANEESSSNANASIVNVSSESDKADWRSSISEPTLLVKVQTAISILIDQNPEAVMKASCDKYEERNNIAKAILKRNWELNDSIDMLKLFVFDLAKYGFAVGHTLPRMLKRDKEILEEIDTENPEKNKYRKIQIIEFNDIYREKLDLYRTWIDDKANLTDKFSVNDWYYEKDYSKEDFDEEFGMYNNSKTVKGNKLSADTQGLNSATKTRDDMITVGFYENKKKDLYCIWIPETKTIIYYSPLPNDDGKLTLWYAYWNLRDPRTIYGIGLFELLKNNKVMYDRFKNMTIDQLTMAIYPMIFFTGPPIDGEDEIKISPDKLIKKQAGTTVDQIKINYDNRGWETTEKLKADMDDATAITPTLEGDVTGQTLGEVLHAKDSALKRLNIPLLNIAKAIEADAYITLSWANQVYSIPEIQKFANGKELLEYEEENNKKASKINPVEGTEEIEAEFLPEMDLGLEEDRDGVLIESKESRFFKIGSEEFPLESIKWEGKITIKARSVVSPNPELERQMKSELYNIVSPVVAQMSSLWYKHLDPETGEMYTPDSGKEMALALYKPLTEILKIHNEKPENWIFEEIILYSENPEMLEKEKEAMAQAEAAKPENDLFVDQASLEPEAEGGMGRGVKQAPNSVVAPSSLTNPLKQVMGNMKASETKANKSL